MIRCTPLNSRIFREYFWPWLPLGQKRSAMREKNENMGCSYRPFWNNLWLDMKWPPLRNPKYAKGWLSAKLSSHVWFIWTCIKLTFTLPLFLLTLFPYYFDWNYVVIHLRFCHSSILKNFLTYLLRRTPNRNRWTYGIGKMLRHQKIPYWFQLMPKRDSYLAQMAVEVLQRILSCDVWLLYLPLAWRFPFYIIQKTG